MNKLTLLSMFVMAGLAPAAFGAGDAAFQKAEQDWRNSRVERLKSPRGWLALVGLQWLHPGENVFGSDPDCAVPLPVGKAPKRAGVLVLENGSVRLKPEPDAGLTMNGRPAVEKVLIDDSGDSTDIVRIGDVSFLVIKRGERIGIRVRDEASALLKNFKGLDYYPADSKWRVTGKFSPYTAPRQVEVPTVIGTTETMTSPGLVTFTIDGKELRLEPVVEDPEDPSLFFIFKDKTSAKETYGSGRFLYAQMPADDGTVILDFNHAYNPPCAFTPYATCPLPPKKNWLPIRVLAGEKVFAGGHHAAP